MDFVTKSIETLQAKLIEKHRLRESEDQERACERTCDPSSSSSYSYHCSDASQAPNADGRLIKAHVIIKQDLISPPYMRTNYRYVFVFYVSNNDRLITDKALEGKKMLNALGKKN